MKKDKNSKEIRCYKDVTCNKNVFKVLSQGVILFNALYRLVFHEYLRLTHIIEVFLLYGQHLNCYDLWNFVIFSQVEVQPANL